MQKEIFVKNIPEGTTITYTNNGQIEQEEYTVTALLEKELYEPRQLSATLKIKYEIYSIKYVLPANIGEIVNDNPTSYIYKKSSQLKPIEVSGYAFLGWYQTFGGKELYPTKEEKGARLGYNLVSNHAFVDGNKRIGLLLCFHFLLLTVLT